MSISTVLGLGAMVASGVFFRRSGVSIDTVRAQWRMWPVAWTMAALLLAVSATRLWQESRQNLELVATLPGQYGGFAVGPKADPIVQQSYRDLRERRGGRTQRSDDGKVVFAIRRDLDSQPAAEIVVPVGSDGGVGLSGLQKGFLISQDGQRLAWLLRTRSETRDARGRVFSSSSKIGVGDLETATVLAEVEVSGLAEFLTLSPKGDRVAIWLAGQWVVYDANGLGESARWDAGNRSNFDFKQVPRPGAFSPDGSRFAHLVFDREGSDAPWRLDVREAGGGELASTRLPEAGRWIALSFQDSSTIALISPKRYFAWQLNSEGRLRLTQSHEWGPFEFTCNGVSDDGRVAIGSGVIRGHSYRQDAGHLLRLPDGAFLGRIPRSPDVHAGCSLSPDGTCFVQNSYSDELKVWRLTPRQLKRLKEATER